MTAGVVAYRARYIFPLEGKPLRNGIITLLQNRVVSIGMASDVAPLDLGNCAILPGLVNAHTHLEFSDLAQPLGCAGQSLPDWIREVIANRRSEGRDTAAAIRQGIHESQNAGTTMLGEIRTDGWQNFSPTVDTTLFQEAICLDHQRFDAILESQSQILQNQSAGLRYGISPHAPYTVHPELLEKLVELAVQFQVPVAMHLAESPEELELLENGSGSFRTFLQSLGVWREEANPQGRKPLDYLKLLSRSPRAIVVHGNYLNDVELDFLAQNSDRMSVCYCPRTHAYFGHPPYPLTEMLSRGIAVCMGTDSRASNPNLNLFEEAKFAAHRHTAVSPQQILLMASLQGAKILSGKTHSHSQVASWAHGMTFITLPAHDTADPYDLLLGEESRVARDITP
jgi:cytosine/adenosine deaminase-related metal-dependent hydrolase